LGPAQLRLAFDFTFQDLYSRDGLIRLDQTFLDWLGARHSALRDRLAGARTSLDGIEKRQESGLLIELAPHLEDFLGELFGITDELRAQQSATTALAPLFALKRRFVFKKAASGMSAEKVAELDGPALASRFEAFAAEPLTDHTYACT